MDELTPDSVEFNKQKVIRDKAVKQLEQWSKTKEGAVRKEEIALLERLDAIAVNETKLADIATNSEISLSDAILSAMDEGYAKQKNNKILNFKRSYFL